MSEQNAVTIAGRLLNFIMHGPDRCCRSKQVCDDIKFASYELVRLQADNDALRVVLVKIDGIRNSIIGSQTVSWSEHVYPMVAALKEAGFQGLTYSEARVKTLTLEDQVAALRVELAEAKVTAEIMTRQMRWIAGRIDKFEIHISGEAAKVRNSIEEYIK